MWVEWGYSLRFLESKIFVPQDKESTESIMGDGVNYLKGKFLSSADGPGLKA